MKTNRCIQCIGEVTPPFTNYCESCEEKWFEKQKNEKKWYESEENLMELSEDLDYISHQIKLCLEINDDKIIIQILLEQFLSKWGK